MIICIVWVVTLFEQIFSKLVIYLNFKYLNSVVLKIPYQKTVACLWISQTSFHPIHRTLVHFLV